MKHLIIGLIALSSLLIFPVQAQAFWPWPDLHLTPPTATPMPPLLKLPVKEFVPLLVTTATPTPTSTLTPTTTPELSPTAGNTPPVTPETTSESTPETTPLVSPTAVADLVASPGSQTTPQQGTGPNLLTGAVLLLILLLLLQNRWPQLKKWLHAKTTPQNES